MARRKPRSDLPEAVVEDYDEKLAARVCALVATGKTLAVACARAGEDHSPPCRLTEDVVYLWMFRSPAFVVAFRTAKQSAMYKYLEDTIDIADDASGDTYEDVTKDGDKIDKPNGAAVNRAKLKVAARQWAMQNMNREVFGEPARGTGGEAGDVSEIRITGGLPD